MEELQCIRNAIRKGEWIVAEADESDGSFKMSSTVGVINNIDFEHVDFYKNIDEIKQAFVDYAQNIPFYGFISINIDDENVKSIKTKIKRKKIITFGFSNDSNYRPLNLKVEKKKWSTLLNF